MINKIYINDSVITGRLCNSENEIVHDIKLPKMILTIDELEDDYTESDLNFIYDKEHCDTVYFSELWIKILDVVENMEYCFEADKIYIYRTITNQWYLNYSGLRSVVVINHNSNE